MPNEITYFDTPYTFINPVRYFKANDPYYYEVDNIPIKQLEEASNFLKDQVDGLLGMDLKPKIEIDRSGFSELKPYATGKDRKVRVKPGRYTARINNAFDITPLQVVAQIGGYSNNNPGWGPGTAGGQGLDRPHFNTWEFETIQGATVSATLDEFQKGLIGTAYMMNGLYERSFVYPVSDGDGVDLNWNPWKYLGNKTITAITGPITTPGYNPPAYGYGSMPTKPEWGEFWRWTVYPNYTGVQPQYNIPESATDYQSSLVKGLAKNQGLIESEFIKRWRGAIRTSVVDVPEELVISIPDYNENDFFYFDSNGDKQLIPSNQRIDLLFIYSKAIDETTTTINKFDINGNPKQLERATLGILKGAGVGISRKLQELTPGTTYPIDPKQLVDIRTPEGELLMFSHPGDHGQTASDNVGFSTSAGIIKGSFPSPDDLLNLAPVLSENLETNTLPLIGQSILPVAYIRVQHPDLGGPILNLVTNEDIIDIRPFFRTTELAYNERAGIAAATPQISIANPVVSEAHLEEMRQEMITPIDSRVTILETRIGGGGDCRVIAAGQVLGGFWGPEGALIRHAKGNTGGNILTTPMSAFVDLVEEDFGYRHGSIPYLPDWDLSLWHKAGNFEGRRVCDFINVGAPWISEIAHGQGAQKWMPPWTGGIAHGNTTATVNSIKETYENLTWINRVGLFGWGSRKIDDVPFAEGEEGPGGTVYHEKVVDLNNRYIQINYVSKKIKLNFQHTTWVEDYHVKVNLLHCVPLVTAYHGIHQAVEDMGPRQAVGVWVQKFKDFFVINVSWAAAPLIPTNTNGVRLNKPWTDRNNAENFAGFVQPYMQGIVAGNFRSYPSEPAGYAEGMYSTQANAHFQEVMNTDPITIGGYNSPNTEPDYVGTATPLLYPSVQWEVVGVGGHFLDQTLRADGRGMSAGEPIVYTV